MIMQNGIGAHVDSKHRAEQLDAIHNPLAAVFKVKASVGIFTTQECPSNTSGDAMVVRRVLQRDLTVSWLRHGSKCRQVPALLIGQNYYDSCRIFNEMWVSWLSREIDLVF